MDGVKLRSNPLLAWQVSWAGLSALIGGVAVIAAGWRLSLFELLFLLWFVGFLAGVELFAPRHQAPDRWAKIRWVLLAGLLTTTLIVSRRILALL